jgi:hypothetical protein
VLIRSEAEANTDKHLRIFTTNVSQINMAHTPILFIFLMENRQYTYMKLLQPVLGIYFEAF